MFVGTTGHDDQIRDNPVLNGTYERSIIYILEKLETIIFYLRICH